MDHVLRKDASEPIRARATDDAAEAAEATSPSGKRGIASRVARACVWSGVETGVVPIETSKGRVVQMKMILGKVGTGPQRV